MSGLPFRSEPSGVWASGGGSTSTGPIPIGGVSRLPTVTNSNLPMNTMSNMGSGPPPVPQTPSTPFPQFQRPVGANNSLISNNYATTNSVPGVNPMAVNLAQNTAQNEANQRRLVQLENENDERRHANMNLTHMGAQVLQGQMDIQEQVLEYQYMLENCMDVLDQQNHVVNEQAEELALLRAKMRHFEYLMDAIKLSKDGNNLMRNMSGESHFIDNNSSCCRDPFSLPAPSTSSFFAGGPTRATASTFQPFNPRYRSPNSRATAAANINDRRSTNTTPAGNAPNRPAAAANNRPSRPGINRN